MKKEFGNEVFNRAGHEVGIVAPRLQAAIERTFKQKIRDVKYKLITDDGLRQVLPYVGMPRFHRHWSFGKQANHWLNEKNSHFYELVINSDPCWCYLAITNRLPMQIKVMAHAIGGHMMFFTRNHLFKDSEPQLVIRKFAQQDERVELLANDPGFRGILPSKRGRDAVEEVIDAARAVQQHQARLPATEIYVREGAQAGQVVRVEKISDDELRQQLAEEMSHVGHLIRTEGATSQFLKEKHEQRYLKLEQALKRHPIEAEEDLLGFLLEPQNTPHLTNDHRALISFVRQQGMYFQPQPRTKTMNEGFASFMEKYLLLQPELGLPFDIQMDLALYWNLHFKSPMAPYNDPYARGNLIWRSIDEKFGYDEEEVAITDKKLDRDDTDLLVETDEEVTHKAVPRNFDKLFEIMETHDDTMFLREYLDIELIETINERSLEWCRTIMLRINGILRQFNWPGNLQMDETNPPLTLRDMLAQVQAWLGAFQMAQRAQQWYGTPAFPINPRVLKTLSTILQLVMAFDADRNKMRNSMIRQGIMTAPPDIRLVDTGRFSGGTWTLQHYFDALQGPLLQSECKGTVALYRRLTGGALRLLTMEEEMSWHGESTGRLVPYQYYCDKYREDGTTVLEGWL